jgi:excisionase family DNA binding protein
MNNVTGLDRPRVLYRIDEAAELLSVSKSRVYELVRSGQLRTVKVGKSHRVPARSLDEYVSRLLRGAAGHGKTA